MQQHKETQREKPSHRVAHRMRVLYRNDEGLRSEIEQHHVILNVLFLQVLQLGHRGGGLDRGVQL